MTREEKGIFWLSLAFIVAAGSVLYYNLKDKKEEEFESELAME